MVVLYAAAGEHTRRLEVATLRPAVEVGFRQQQALLGEPHLYRQPGGLRESLHGPTGGMRESLHRLTGGMRESPTQAMRESLHRRTGGLRESLHRRTGGLR